MQHAVYNFKTNRSSKPEKKEASSFTRSRGQERDSQKGPLNHSMSERRGNTYVNYTSNKV